MIFRQLFDSVSGTYSYVLASRAGGEALIIDPVLEKVDRYCQLLRELDLKLVKAVDTHLHADHVTGLGELRDRTHCITIMGEQSKADVVSMRVADGDKVTIEGLVARRDVHARPHRRFLQLLDGRPRLHRRHAADPRHRTHRFPERLARAQYESIFNRLLKLPEETLVYPAHDYKGDTVSTIGEEKRYNPRLQVRSVDEYVELMANLKLPNPKMMDVAVPANMHVGLHQDELDKQGLALTAREAIARLGQPGRPAGRSARDRRARQARHAGRRAARALSGHRRQPEARRHAARGRGGDRAPHRVLLRLWRTLGDGREGRQGRRASPMPRISPAASTPGRRPAGRW